MNNGQLKKVLAIIYVMAATTFIIVDKGTTLFRGSPSPETVAQKNLELRVQRLEDSVLPLKDVPIQLAESRLTLAYIQETVKRIEADLKDHMKPDRK